MGYHGNIQLKTSGGGGREERREKETESLIMWLVVLELLTDGWRLHGGCRDFYSKLFVLSTWWVDAAKCWSVMGQCKMSCAGTGKRNKSKVNPRLD